MSIIGVSGKIGSGKSLLTQIIKYVDYKHNHFAGKTILSRADFISSRTSYEYLSRWEEVKFAGKLKDIVCLLIGCTREQLEDSVFKNKPLGDKWNFTYYNIIDRAGNVLEKTYDSNDAKSSLPFWEENSVNHPVNISEVTQILTPRLMMQLLGTECIRNIIHPNTWVNALLADYKINSKWIISDLRFENEINLILDHNPLIIRMESEIIRYTNDTYLYRAEGFDHESETGLDSYKFQNVIHNYQNTSIDDLIVIVDAIMIKNNLI